MIGNVISELPNQLFMTIVLFVCWYYPSGFFLKALDFGGASEMNSRAGFTFAIVLNYMLWGSTLIQALAAIIPDAATAANIFNLLSMLSLIFSG